MAPTRCPACPDGMKGPGKYLCIVCWFALSDVTRRALNRRDRQAMARLQELYRQITAGVALAEIRITA
jgi:hypothetical protein